MFEFSANNIFVFFDLFYNVFCTLHTDLLTTTRLWKQPENSRKSQNLNLVHEEKNAKLNMHAHSYKVKAMSHNTAFLLFLFWPLDLVLQSYSCMLMNAWFAMISTEKWVSPIKYINKSAVRFAFYLFQGNLNIESVEMLTLVSRSTQLANDVNDSKCYNNDHLMVKEAATLIEKGFTYHSFKNFFKRRISS